VNTFPWKIINWREREVYYALIKSIKVNEFVITTRKETIAKQLCARNARRVYFKHRKIRNMGMLKTIRKEYLLKMNYNKNWQ